MALGCPLGCHRFFGLLPEALARCVELYKVPEPFRLKEGRGVS